MNKAIQNSFGFKDRDIETITRIFKKYPEVEEVHIFGSRSMGDFRPGSDADLALINPSIGWKTQLRLKSDFEESSLPFRVDLVHLPTLNDKSLADHIQRVGSVFYVRH